MRHVVATPITRASARSFVEKCARARRTLARSHGRTARTVQGQDVVRLCAVKRRDVLHAFGAAAALSLVGGRARAIGPASEVSIGRVRHGGTWDTRPDALRRLLWEAGKRTSIHTARDGVTVSLEPGSGASSADSDALFRQPLLWMTGEGAMPPLSPAARARLAAHLRYGGMLVVDAPSPRDAFVQSARQEIAAVLPGTRLSPLAPDHVTYKSFYLLDGAVGRVRDDRHLHGVELGARTAVVLSTNDLSGALERDRFGAWRFECEPDGDSQREMALRLATNLLMYATCLDYKSDQVHIPFIMKKKRR